jgi:hypothetical protein
MPLMSGFSVSAAATRCWEPVGSAGRPRGSRPCRRRGDAVGEAAAALVEGGVADLLVDADGGGDALLGHPLTGAETRLVLRLADVVEQAELLGDVAAGVHRDDRDAGRDAASIAGPRASGVGDRHDQPVGVGGDRRLDQLRHGDHVEGVRGLVLDLDAHVLAGLGDAVLDDRPERVGGLAVGDDDEAERGAVRGVLGRGDPGEAEDGDEGDAEERDPPERAMHRCVALST